MKQTLATVCVVAFLATALPHVNAEEAKPESEGQDGIPKEVFTGNPVSRMRAALAYADLPLNAEQLQGLDNLFVSLEGLDPTKGWIVDATVEGCGGDGSCGGSYTHDESTHTYVGSGNITQNSCYNNEIQTNIALGDNNKFCYQYAEGGITIGDEEGNECSWAQGVGHNPPCVLPGDPTTFLVALVCTKAFLHQPGPCPGIADLH